MNNLTMNSLDLDLQKSRGIHGIPTIVIQNISLYALNSKNGLLHFAFQVGGNPDLYLSSLKTRVNGLIRSTYEFSTKF